MIRGRKSRLSVDSVSKQDSERGAIIAAGMTRVSGFLLCFFLIIFFLSLFNLPLDPPPVFFPFFLFLFFFSLQICPENQSR